MFRVIRERSAHQGTDTPMNRSSVRSAGLAILLTMNGCGFLVSSDTNSRSPGLSVAEAALLGGSGQVALQVSEGVLRESPGDARALAIKGDALSLLGDYTNAEAVYLTLLAKDPASIRANIGLGRIKLTKDPAAAEALFQLVLKRDPKDLTALNNLGIARDLQGRHADAQPAYRQALAINPDLESAQVNLALSMAMNGQGGAAAQMLQAKATQAGASTKVKHDYAVVLALSGNRAEAERVLADSLAPEEIRQVLDSVTGSRSRVVRETSPESGTDRRVASRMRDDGVEPDVVQVPEVPAPVTRVARTPSPVAMATAMQPMVVRPAPSAAAEADSPATQPVNPIAAAVANQRALALPTQSTQMLGQASVMQLAQEPDVAAPKVVAMPPAQRATPAPMRVAAADATRVALPDGPPPPPVLAPAPLPSSYKPLPVARGEPALAKSAPESLPVQAPVTTAHPVGVAPVPLVPALANPAQSPAMVMATNNAPKTARQPAAEHATSNADATAPIARRDGADPMVQFAAADSEETAYSFWQSLVHRFPAMLGQRQPTVIRFEKGGAVFWRVRTSGFDTVADALSLCARVRADGQDCFVPRS